MARLIVQKNQDMFDFVFIDTLVSSIWVVLFIIILVFQIKELIDTQFKPLKFFVPPIVGVMNIGWEITASIKCNWYWVHCVWAILDIFIFVYNITVISTFKRRLMYFGYFISSFCLLYFFVFPIEQGMFISSFVIDLVMAIEFLFAMNHVSKKGRITIGSVRLVADMGSWICYFRRSSIVAVLGAIILIINIFYLWNCVSVRKRFLNRKRIR